MARVILSNRKNNRKSRNNAEENKAKEDVMEYQVKERKMILQNYQLKLRRKRFKKKNQ